MDRRAVHAVVRVARQHALHGQAQRAPGEPRNESENNGVKDGAQKGLGICKRPAFDLLQDAHNRIDLINCLKTPAHRGCLSTPDFWPTTGVRWTWIAIRSSESTGNRSRRFRSSTRAGPA